MPAELAVVVWLASRIPSWWCGGAIMIMSGTILLAGSNGTQTLCFVQMLFIKFVTVSQQQQHNGFEGSGPTG